MQSSREESKPRVLVVDDEPLLLRAMKRALDRDYDVTCAEGGAAALELLASGAQRYDVILCDLRMDGMSGQELHAEILRTEPGLADRMVFICGEAWSPQAQSFLDAIPNLYLEKPVELSELRYRIRIIAGASAEQRG